MEYAILDDLISSSESRKQEFQEKTNSYFESTVERIDEPFLGSSENIRLYVFKNYVSSTGLMNLGIVIRDVNTGEKSTGGLAIHNVECAVFPLYLLPQNAFDLPEPEELPDLHPDIIKFIINKRSLPKKPAGIEANPEKYKWTVNEIAKELHISNRLVSRYCRVRNI